MNDNSGGPRAPELRLNGQPTDRPGNIDIEHVEAELARFAANQRLTANKKELAEMLGICTKTVDRMRSRGQLPAAMVVGIRSLRWYRREIVAWVEAGMPDRRTWERIRGADGQGHERPQGAD
jgi:excisionase family DNA binding protein